MTAATVAGRGSARPRRLARSLRGAGLSGAALAGPGAAGRTVTTRHGLRLIAASADAAAPPVDRARRLERPLYTVMGGFHLSGPDLRAAHPPGPGRPGRAEASAIVPAHCTGWRAQHAIGARFGEASIPNIVGTCFQL